MKFFLLLIISLSLNSCIAQELERPVIDHSGFMYDEFYDLDSNMRNKYPFVNFDKNNFEFRSMTSPNWDGLNERLNDLINTKSGKLNFYHIGGSHLQADIYTHDVRQKIQTRWDSLPGERGWVFPFNFAKTNNPSNYRFSSPNTWTGYRGVKNYSNHPDFGMLGMHAKCNDSTIELQFMYKLTEVKEPIASVCILHNKGVMPYRISMDGDTSEYHVQTDTSEGVSIVSFVREKLDFKLLFAKNTSSNSPLRIYGLRLMNDLPGVNYTSIGVNGAGLYTYLSCKSFEKELALYPPDFFAFSVGTNDGNVPYSRFDPMEYKMRLDSMIQLVLRTNPDCAILLTVPNDSYYRRKYLNRNIGRERTVIYELAEKYNCPVWDLYGLMGELGSSRTWQRNKLMKSDLVHFTRAGYHLKADLYFDAFLKWMDIMEKTKTTSDGATH